MPVKVLRTLLAIKREHYDLAIDPCLRSASARFLLCWSRAQTNVGYRWGRWLRDRCLTHRVDKPNEIQHCSQEPVNLIRHALLANSLADGIAPPALGGRPYWPGYGNSVRTCGQSRFLRTTVLREYPMGCPPPIALICASWAAFKTTAARRYGPLGARHQNVYAADDAAAEFAGRVATHLLASSQS